MIMGIIIAFIHRIKMKKGIGVRFIQLIVLIIALPGLFFLAIEKFLPIDLFATIMGSIIGFTLSAFSKEKSD
jgi:hypothetical protein